MSSVSSKSGVICVVFIVQSVDSVGWLSSDCMTMAGVLTDAGMLQEASDVLKGKSVTVRDCDLPTDGRRGMFIPSLSIIHLVVCLSPDV